jgi:flavin-binding protein dodecin
MAQPKYTLYKYVRLKGGSWRYCRAALYFSIEAAEQSTSTLKWISS